ncbi:MAG: hypothetical protein SGARI_001773, partial [Bacillariaceae sp.]
MKYVKKDASFIIKNEVEQWGTSEDGTLQRDVNIYRDVINQYGCAKDFGRPRSKLGPSPHSDFVHLTGRSKPWNMKLEELQKAIEATPFKHCNDREKWFFTLTEVLQDMNMLHNVSLDFIDDKKEAPPVGIAPSFQQMGKYLYDKKKNGWKQYEFEEDEPEVI